MSNKRAILTIISLITGALVFLFISFALVSAPFNTYKLAIIRRNFNEMNNKNIAQSRLIKNKSEVAHWGNSNMCDYYVGQFRVSNLSKEEIEKAYEGLRIKSFRGDKNTPLELDLLFTDDEWFRENAYYWSPWWQENSRRFDIRPEENAYLVYVISDGHSHIGDFRCK